ALEQLGLGILRTNNPQDMKVALEIIEYIQKLGAQAEIQIQLVPLQHADATSLANQLGIFLQRVIIAPNSTSLAPAGARPGGTGLPQQQQQPGQQPGGIAVAPLGQGAVGIGFAQQPGGS